MTVRLCIGGMIKEYDTVIEEEEMGVHRWRTRRYYTPCGVKGGYSCEHVECAIEKGLHDGTFLETFGFMLIPFGIVLLLSSLLTGTPEILFWALVVIGIGYGLRKLDPGPNDNVLELQEFKIKGTVNGVPTKQIFCEDYIETKYNHIKKIDNNTPPRLAVILSLLVLGLGHIYLGRTRRGLVLIFLTAAMGILIAAVAPVSIGFFWIICCFLCSYDAYQIARGRPAPFDFLEKYIG